MHKCLPEPVFNAIVRNNKTNEFNRNYFFLITTCQIQGYFLK